jgi:hypothetical protein
MLPNDFRLLLLSGAHHLAVTYSLKVRHGQIDDDINLLPSIMLEQLSAHQSDDILTEAANMIASLAATEAITLRVNPHLHQPAIERCDAIRNLVRPYL